MRRLLEHAVLAIALLPLGCGGNGATSSFIKPGVDGGAGGPPGTDAGPANLDGSPLLGGDAAAFDGAAGQVAEVFGESPDTLYKLDPITKAVVVVGMFQGCSQVIDLALDKDSNMFATTFNGVYRVDRTTAVCTLIAMGSYPNSLSFVPAGTLDPNVEALVGYVGAEYIRIDPSTGAITNVGTIGGGLSSSGDIVSVKGGGTYLTVNGPGCGDCLIEVDPASGALKKNWGPVGYSSVFGLAFWAGAVYGFDNGGDLFQVNFNGAALQTTSIPIPNKPAGLQFWGAGSTTSAPPSKNN